MTEENTDNAELLAELTSQGFEIVKDESGQDLVKLLFMDENDEASGYALVNPEDAKKILSGEAALQNVLDDEGKQVLTIAPVVNEEPGNADEPSGVTQPDNATETLPQTVTDSTELVETCTDATAGTTTSATVADVTSDKQDVDQHQEQSESTAASREEAPADSQDMELTQAMSDDTEQYTLTEHSTVIDNKTVQVVTLVDAQGQVLDQKQGEVGEQVTLEMHGQLFAYEMHGLAADGEPLTSTLLVSTSESEQPNESETAYMSTSEQTVTQADSTTSKETNASDTTDPNAIPTSSVTAAAVADDVTSASAVSGQQFTLTEATGLTSDGRTVQTVILTDERDNILDQKEGRTGEHVIIEMSGNSLEYVFLGPTETGETITTTLVVTTEAETADNESHFSTAASEATNDDTESGLTAATWCPSGLPTEFYTILRRQAETVVATRIPTNADGSPFYGTEPYHRKLGSYATYQEMVEVVKKYHVGSAHGETLNDYEVLRNYAKIYRPSGPQSRALNQYELALNEAAAQICRYQSSLLFHKRALFHLAKETVDRSQSLANSERRQHYHQTGTAQRQPTGSKPQQLQQQQHPAANHVPPTSIAPYPIVPQTAAVGGRVASSQLAMLESRGLTGMQQQQQQQQQSHSQQYATSLATASSTDTTSATTSSMTSGTAASMPQMAPVKTNSQQQQQQQQQQSMANGIAPSTSPGKSSMSYLSSLPRRDPPFKLNNSQEHSLRAAALDVLIDLPRLDLKPKAECTNNELACWDQAKRLALTEQPTCTDTAQQMLQLLEDTDRLANLRESAAIYGRPQAGFLRPPMTQVPALIPYEVACNEAACLLASGLPSLLTHRRDFSELAKKVVRNSGCLFTNTGSGVDKLAGVSAVSGGTASYQNRFYSDQIPELDLSAADHLLTDPMDRSDSPDSGCCVSPILQDVTRQSEGLDNIGQEQDTKALANLNLKVLAMSCEECNNVIDDVTIFTSTGTDSLKRVRILNLSDCGFTGLVPMHLNQCCNLVELNLSNNALSALPRCLHLPKLKRLNLRGNPRLLQPAASASGGQVEPPLVEQFPRLVTLELDPQLATLLSWQALSYLCPYLKSISGTEFVGEPLEATIKAAQQAKNSLSTLIYSKWEDDISTFYKKGIPKRDTFRIIETLVLHAVKRASDISEPFKRCSSILARRVAEDFLVPKIIDDEDEEGEEDLCGTKSQPTGSDDDDEDDEDDECSDEEDQLDMERTTVDETGKPTGAKRRTKKSTIISLTVEEREAEAAAANLALLPDDPPDRLINVVGQALRHGKTVVYAVIRTAARQPNGELIPVGGGQGITSCTTNTTVALTSSRPMTTSVEMIDPGYEDEMETDDMDRAPLPRGKQFSGRPWSYLDQRIPMNHRGRSKGGSTLPTHSVIPGSRRPGLLYRPVLVQQSSPAPRRIANRPTPQPTIAVPRNTPTAVGTTPGPTTTVTSTVTNHTPASQYVVRPSHSLAQPTYVMPAKPTPPPVASPCKTIPPVVDATPAAVIEISEAVVIATSPVATEPPASPRRTTTSLAPKSPRTPTRRKGRPTSKKVADSVEIPASDLLKVTIPPPHDPPPATMRMSTRDTNRLKRFSAYGVIDTAAALAGDRQAIMAAALAADSERETATARHIIEHAKAEQAHSRLGVVMLSEEDAAVAEAAAATPVVLLDAGGVPESVQLQLSPNNTNSERRKEIVAIQAIRKKEQVVEVASNQRRRAPVDTGDIGASVVDTTTTTISTPVTRKRVATAATTPRTASPKATEPKRKSAGAGGTGSQLVNLQTRAPPAKTSSKSLSQLGSVVDYDPVHFIRCHARDNDPLDCSTKVWRCVFEPSVNDPHNETSTVVATCGGECVCLIDCRSGRVMKRFKHFGEEFYSLAWTTVEMAAGHKTNLLAAAGKLREIRLLHPEQLVCYAEMRGHKDDIACMIFHPNKPTVLFSGDAKATILIWDIGIPSAPEYRTRHQQLMRLVCPRASLNPILNMVFLPKFDALLAGCEDGVFSWTLPELRKEKLNEERTADWELKLPTRREPCFDGLAQLSDNLVVVKCVEEGEIYVFDYTQVGQRASKRSSGKHPMSIELRGQLRWQTTDEIYINVTSRAGLSAVVCGDNEGTIWLYDLAKQVEEDRKFKAKPVKILEWPECSIGGTKEEEEDSRLKESITSGFKNPVVNTTDISHDGEYLVAVTDNNLVCIWKFSG